MHLNSGRTDEVGVFVCPGTSIPAEQLFPTTGPTSGTVNVDQVCVVNINRVRLKSAVGRSG